MILPFYISTSEASDQEIHEALDKCMVAGANACQTVRTYKGDNEFEDIIDVLDYRLFGVNADNDTMFANYPSCFRNTTSIPVVKVTIETLDQHLAIQE